MVSIMRSEQTLRLIQLYHANYPEIARNNQDADGRNLKLQMWAQITEELNKTFETAFTVEQFKKKVQNVQCTSRQKLFSGKRNLGEAEVEYLRLFESDKISEETLAHRAKNRRISANNSSSDFLMLRESHQQMGEYQFGKMDNGEWEDGEDEGEGEGEDTTTAQGSPRGRSSGGRADGSGIGAANEEGGTPLGRISRGTEEGPNGGVKGTTPETEGSQGGTITTALSSIGALFGAYGGGTTVAESVQMDIWTQQVLLAMVNAATINGGATPDEGGENGGRESGRERGRGKEEGTSTTMGGREWKRKQPPEEDGAREVETAQMGAPARKKRDRQTDEEKERSAAGEPSWAGELLKAQREVLGQQRQMLAHFANGGGFKVPRVISSSVSDSASSLSNPSPASSSSPASPLPSSSFASHAVLCQCSANRNGNAALLSLERELCARMDTTNAMLARVVELLLERFPPIG